MSRATTGSVVAALCAVCLLGVPARATVLVPASLAELSREAHLIARGRVLRTESVAAADWRSIETIVTLDIEGALKGRIGSTLQFRTPGGEAGRSRRLVVGAPEFRPGQRVVVFLHDRGDGLPYVIGLNQGVFRLVERDGVLVVTPPVVQGPPGVPQAVVRGGGASRALPLAEFEREVRAVVGAAR